MKNTLKKYPTPAKIAVVAVGGGPLHLDVLKDSKTLTVFHATKAYKKEGKVAR